jgi:hypothetical protein
MNDIANGGHASPPSDGYPRWLWTKLSKTSRRMGAMRVKPEVLALCLKTKHFKHAIENAIFFRCQV